MLSNTSQASTAHHKQQAEIAKEGNEDKEQHHFTNTERARYPSRKVVGYDTLSSGQASTRIEKELASCAFSFTRVLRS